MEALKVNTKPVIKEIKEQFGKRLSYNIMSGKYVSAFKGRGIEFEGFRDYIVGDDASLIDWKASKRANKLLIKQYVEERNIDVLILLDASSSMLFGSENKLKIEYAIELAITLAYVVIQSGSSVGLLVFSDKIDKIIDLGAGAGHHTKIVKILTEPKLYKGGICNLSKALRFARQLIRRNSVLIIISDFLGLDEAWRRSIITATMEYDTLAFIVRDKLDEQVPRGGYVNFMDPFTGENLVMDSNKIRKHYKQAVFLQEEDVRKAIVHAGASILSLETSEPFFKKLIIFFKRRLMRSR